MRDLATQYTFFHWHLVFPQVFARGGFDCVLGNPPWERVNLQEKEWFAERSPEIANAPNAAARTRLIESLKTTDPRLHRQFLEDSRQAEGESHLLRNSGRYPLCGRGDINLYTVFAEGMRALLNAGAAPAACYENGKGCVAGLRDLGFEFLDVTEAEIRRGKDFVRLKNGPFDVDLVFAPDGIESFAAAWKSRVDAEGFPVCHPDDIIRSKEAAGRAKDLESLPRLRAFRDYWKARR